MLNDDYTMYDSQININPEMLYYSFRAVKNLESNFETLAAAFNSVNIENNEISTHLLADSRAVINSLKNDKVSDLSGRVEAVKKVLENNDESVALLYSSLDSQYSSDELYVGASDLKTYLSENYDTFRELENGGYFIEADNGDEYYFSEDCTLSDVHLIAYYPGLGKGGDIYYNKNNSDTLRTELLENGVPSGTVVAISARSKDEYYNRKNQNLFDRFDIIANDIGINVTSVQAIGFSNGGDMPFVRLNDYLDDHPEIKDCSIICIDGGCVQNIYGGDYPCNNLVERNVPIYIISSKGANADESYYDLNTRSATNLSNNGFNVTFILDSSDNSHHSGANSNVFANGLYNYLSGRSASFDNASNYSSIPIDTISIDA